MNPQHAHRLSSALIQHGRGLITCLREFGTTGYFQPGRYLYLYDNAIAIGIDSTDMNKLLLTRERALFWAAHIETFGVDVVFAHLNGLVGDTKIVVNDHTAVMSRPTLIHTKSNLHKSGKTKQAVRATNKGRERDASRAASFNATCSAPSMMSHGRHRDKMPITLHTPKPTGLMAK